MKNLTIRKSAQKSILVTIIGKPNSGKSTLLNYIIGQKISIVTPKVQTTRSVITGITTVDNTQIIFFDTPGIFEPKRTLEKAMVKCAWSSVHNADLIVMLIDINDKHFSDDTSKILERLKHNKLQPIFVLNKIDLLKTKQSLSKLKLTIIDYLKNNFPTPIIFEISAASGYGVKNLLNYIKTCAKHSPWIYDEDEVTTIPSRFLAAEITREQLFMTLHQELPYNLTVQTEKWEEIKPNEVKIYQTIIVAKDNYKAMILGNKGAKIKEISQKSRIEIEKVLELKTHLFLFVKVRKEWENYIDN